MALDTAAKRAAALGVGLPPGVILPVPDGSIDAADRAALAGIAVPAAASSLVEVPDVVGDDEATATAALEGAGFVVSVDSTYSASVSVGDVITQNPAGGAQAEAGSTVTIVVSLGPASGSDCIVPFRRRGRR
jgi:hypothetical protein